MRERLLYQLLYLLEPIGFVWFCLLVLTAALWWRRQRRFALVAAFIATFVTVIGSTSVPDRLLASLERPYARVHLAGLPTADAIVLLGGGATPSRYEISGVHLTPAGDRLVMAHALFRMNKAPVLLLGGNALPLDSILRIESELVRDLFLTWGVPPEALIPLGTSADTHDEALRVRALATQRGWSRLLLVTSANHQRRATATFRAQGLDVTPVPCNFFSTVSTVPSAGVGVPRAAGFVKMATWLHEEVGWFMYRRRGWIAE